MSLIKDFFGWLVVFIGVLLLLQLAFAQEWLALIVTVTAAAFTAAALEWFFGGNRGKHHL